MANNVTKLLQVSEEAAPLVQIPVMVGNEMFVLTQQDVRRTEDIRYVCYNRITPNVQLIPTAAPAAAPLNYYGGLITPLTLPSNCALQDLFCPKKMEVEHVPEPAPRNVADVATQLAWSKDKETDYDRSDPAPLRYSAATSTSGLTKTCGCQHERPKSRSQHTSCQCHAARNACVQTTTTSSAATNTDSKTIWKPAMSDVSVSESKKNLNRPSAANESDKETKHNFNARNACVQTRSTTDSKTFWKPEASAENLSDDETAELSKCPSRPCKSQQTCTYSVGQSYHRSSPREGRFRPQQQQQQQPEQSDRYPISGRIYHTRDYAQDQSAARLQSQTDANPLDQSRAHTQELLLEVQDQSNCLPKCPRRVYFSEQEYDSSV